MPSIFDRLPAELASTIFSFYTFSLSDNMTPLLLGAVCQRWRRIAWSTPEIWSVLTTSFLTPDVRRAELRVNLIEEWLTRSGQLDLSVSIHFEPSFDSDFEVNLTLSSAQRLVRILNLYCDRLYSLELDMPWDALVLLDTSFCVSPKLRQLSLNSDEDGIPFLNLTGFTPRIVKITVLQLDFRSIDWSCVTDFTMSNLSVYRILQVLQMAPNLRECHFEEVMDYDEEGLPDEGYPSVTHHQLQTLYIVLAFGGPDRPFFENVTLPALEDLAIHGIDVVLNADLVSFFTRSACRLRILSLEETSYTGLHLVDIAEVLPSLQELCITPFNNVKSLGRFYQALTRHLSTHASPLLPNLRTFECHGSGDGFPWPVLPNFLVPLSTDGSLGRRPLELVIIKCQRRTDGSLPYIDAQTLSQILPFAREVHFDLRIGDSGNLLRLSVDRLLGNL